MMWDVVLSVAVGLNLLAAFYHARRERQRRRRYEEMRECVFALILATQQSVLGQPGEASVALRDAVDRMLASRHPDEERAWREHYAETVDPKETRH